MGHPATIYVSHVYHYHICYWICQRCFCHRRRAHCQCHFDRFCFEYVCHCWIYIGFADWIWDVDWGYENEGFLEHQSDKLRVCRPIVENSFLQVVAECECARARCREIAYHYHYDVFRQRRVGSCGEYVFLS